MTAFDTLGLAEPLLRAVKHAGFTEATPIQAQAIPSALEGRDMLGIAQTGTGKTAAFALPILHRLLSQRGRPAPCTCRVLVLAPTRELAAQIEASFRTLSKFMRISTALVTGGAKHGPQIGALKRGVDVLVATPGRLIEHLDNGIIRLNTTQVAVLDEADHMLDLGFLPPIRKLMGRLPQEHQTLLFSATMPKEIAGLADDPAARPGQGRRHAGGDHGRAGGPEGLPAGRRHAPRPADRLPAPAGLLAHPGLHPHQARRRPPDQAARRPRRGSRRPSTATSPRASAPAPWRASSGASCRC